MKTKRKAEVGNLPGFRKSVEEVAKEEIAEKSEETPVQQKPKIAIPLKEDGSFDFDSMRNSTKEKLKAAIASTPDLREVPKGESSVLFPPAVIWGMYGMLGTAESLVAQKAGKIPREIADRVFTYTPEEIGALTPPTARVLQKYAADWLIKYQDEIALATLLTSITIQKVNACIIMSKQSQGNSAETPKKDEVIPEVKPN